MSKILTVGGATTDIFIQYDLTLATTQTIDDTQFLMIEEGKKINVSSLLHFIGGGATNTAASFHALGHNVTACFKIGNDHTGAAICKELSTKGINITPYYDKHLPTGTSFILPCPSGDRLIFVHRGASTTLSMQEIDQSDIQSADHIYITSLHETATKLLEPLTRQAHKYNIPVSCNPGQFQIKNHPLSLLNSLPYIDILIINCNEAIECAVSLLDITKKTISNNAASNDMPTLLRKPIEHAGSSFMLTDFFHAMHQKGPRIIALTNGADGAYISEQNTIYYHPTLPAQVASTLGAGDAFGAAFVSMLMHGESIEQAIRAAMLNSRSAIEHIGAQKGLLDLTSLHNQLNALNSSLLKRCSS